MLPLRAAPDGLFAVGTKVALGCRERTQSALRRWGGGKWGRTALLNGLCASLPFHIERVAGEACAVTEEKKCAKRLAGKLGKGRLGSNTGSTQDRGKAQTSALAPGADTLPALPERARAHALPGPLAQTDTDKCKDWKSCLTRDQSGRALRKDNRT